MQTMSSDVQTLRKTNIHLTTTTRTRTTPKTIEVNEEEQMRLCCQLSESEINQSTLLVINILKISDSHRKFNQQFYENTRKKIFHFHWHLLDAHSVLTNGEQQAIHVEHNERAGASIVASTSRPFRRNYFH